MYEVKFLDKLDFAILLAVHNGIDSCNYIATLTGRSKRVISGRVDSMNKIGLINSIDANQKYFHKSYELTQEGINLLESTLSSVNFNLTRTVTALRNR